MGLMGLRVLIAEDDNSVQAMLKLTLSFEDPTYQIYLASDGQQAIEMCADIAPDVLITDSLLPLASGEEVVRASEGRDMTVISFSGSGEKPDWADHVITTGEPGALTALKAALRSAAEARP